MKQNAKVLSALKKGPLTPLSAMQKLGVQRLAARVNDLREMGFPIATQMVKVKTRDGESRVARYYLA